MEYYTVYHLETRLREYNIQNLGRESAKEIHNFIQNQDLVKIQYVNLNLL